SAGDTAHAYSVADFKKLPPAIQREVVQLLYQKVPKTPNPYEQIASTASERGRLQARAISGTGGGDASPYKKQRLPFVRVEEIIALVEKGHGGKIKPCGDGRAFYVEKSRFGVK
ncbi:MAG: hypothetical protein UY05_C0051G0007, partial [Candidatus Peregrinibacteria bacterium GW2011_GWA2_47_7]